MTLPVPDQLSVQLGKCKTVRGADYYKSRQKTAEVSVGRETLTALKSLHWIIDPSIF